MISKSSSEDAAPWPAAPLYSLHTLIKQLRLLINKAITITGVPAALKVSQESMW
jgi:hypothetical protein